MSITLVNNDKHAGVKIEYQGEVVILNNTLPYPQFDLMLEPQGVGSVTSEHHDGTGMSNGYTFTDDVFGTTTVIISATFTSSTSGGTTLTLVLEATSCMHPGGEDNREFKHTLKYNWEELLEENVLNG